MGQIKELVVESEFLQGNYAQFCDSGLRIGFTSNFVEKPGSTIKSITVNEKVRGIPVSFDVRLCKLTFGPNDEYEVTGIVTDRVDISSKLPMGGFNSYSHEDTGDLMQKGIVLLAAETNMMICQKVNSWPYAIAVVQPMTPEFEIN